MRQSKECPLSHSHLSTVGAGRPAPSGSVTVRAPAKVNLHLGVGGRRPDGYHDVATVLQAVSLYDEIIATFREAMPGSGAIDAAGPLVTVEVAGEGADARAGAPAGAAGSAGGASSGGIGSGGARPALTAVPTDADNLAVRAALLLGRETGVRSGVHLALRKAIPVAAGMAGGSADAAGALVACDALWGTGRSVEQLAQLAAQLGSDVAFPVLGGTALGTGRGEVLSPVAARGEYHWVFALADGGLSTPAVYAEFDRLGYPPDREPTPPDAVLAALLTGDPVALGSALTNDLEPAALRLRPSLRDVLDAGRELGAVGAIVSGSGPTCAFLATGAVGSVGLAAGLADLGICRAVRRAHGPVAGARGDGPPAGSG
ncbi:MAG: 4-(cytidine 5'-diphospho)-2-C-methyl-D-erythritol kinase [Frankia sp.]